MAGDHQIRLACGFKQGEVGFAAGGVVGLEEIDAGRRQIGHRLPRRLGRIDHPMVGTVLSAVQGWTAAHDAWPEQLSRLDPPAQGVDLLESGAHVAHSGDALGDQQGGCRRVRVRQVGV